MKKLFIVTLTILIGNIAQHSAAQTTRDLFYWYKGTYGANYSFTDKSCREVLTSNGSAYFNVAHDVTFYSSVYCSAFSQPVFTMIYTRMDWPSPSGIKTCFVSKSYDPTIISSGDTCGGGLVKTTAEYCTYNGPQYTLTATMAEEVGASYGSYWVSTTTPCAKKKYEIFVKSSRSGYVAIYDRYVIYR